MLAAGAIGLLATSCAYDPYYSGGYGYSDYGYSGGSYSTSLFISTGDSRWGYDPYCHSYYDYHRRAYYDPFLYGYYPVGYRPPVVYGVPHPHGWRPGSRYCPPPSRIHNHNLSNYRDREGSYRRSNFSWSQNARQRDQGTPNFRVPDRGRQENVRDPRRENDNRSRDDNRSREDYRSREDNRPVRQQFPGFDQNRQNQRPSGNQGSDFRRTERPENNRSREIDRSQFENRMRENRQRETPPPSINRTVNVPPSREMQQRQAPQFDRGATRERSETKRGNNEGSRSSSSERSSRSENSERGHERRRD